MGQLIEVCFEHGLPKKEHRIVVQHGQFLWDTHIRRWVGCEKCNERRIARAMKKIERMYGWGGKT